MKTITQIFLKILFLFFVAVIGFAWWVQSKMGNSIPVFMNIKNHLTHKVENYTQEKERAVSTYIEKKKDTALTKLNDKLKDVGLIDDNSINIKPHIIKHTPEVLKEPNTKGNNIAQAEEIKKSVQEDQKNIETKSEFNHLSIPFFYDPSSAPSNLSKEEVLGLLSKVSETWTQACNVSFDYRGDRLSDYVDGNNTMPTKEGLVKWGSLPGSAIGRAHQGNNYGYAKGFVLMLNKNFFSKPQNTHLLYSTVLHEMGHVIGLPHSKNSNSIMFWQQDNRKQVLNDTDKTMCKYYRARWNGLSASAASDKYGILMNESSNNEQPEEE